MNLLPCNATQCCNLSDSGSGHGGSRGGWIRITRGSPRDQDSQRAAGTACLAETGQAGERAQRQQAAGSRAMTHGSSST